MDKGTLVDLSDGVVAIQDALRKATAIAEALDECYFSEPDITKRENLTASDYLRIKNLTYVLIDYVGVARNSADKMIQMNVFST